MFSAGVGVGSRSRVFKNAGVGVGFSKMLESESGFQKCWSRSRVFKNAGVGVGFSKMLESGFQKCWSRSRVFKNAGVGVGFSKMLESESGFQKCWSRSRVFKNAGVGVGFLKLSESGVCFSKLLESEVGILKNLPTPQPWKKIKAWPSCLGMIRARIASQKLEKMTSSTVEPMETHCASPTKTRVLLGTCARLHWCCLMWLFFFTYSEY